jgi:hypothetical protein
MTSSSGGVSGTLRPGRERDKATSRDRPRWIPRPSRGSPSEWDHPPRPTAQSAPLLLVEVLLLSLGEPPSRVYDRTRGSLAAGLSRTAKFGRTNAATFSAGGPRTRGRPPSVNPVPPRNPHRAGALSRGSAGRRQALRRRRGGSGRSLKAHVAQRRESVVVVISGPPALHVRTVEARSPLSARRHCRHRL